METIFRVILPVLVIAFALHRGYYIQKHGREEDTLKSVKRDRMKILEITARIRFEETLMLEYFGDQYRQYMKSTGRLFPKFIQ